MSYNLLNYPETPGQSDFRYNDFKDIVHYIHPDMVLVCELRSEAAADSLLVAINTQGVSYYQRAPQYFNFGNYSLGNMLFYNTQKLGFVSQQQINTVSREPSHYRLYAKDPDLSCHGDTIYLDAVAVHLKAGSIANDSANIQTRLTQCQDIMTFLNGLPGTSNVVLGGDFNFYSNDFTNTSNPDYEPAYGELTDAAHLHSLNDVYPVWLRNDVTYTHLHSQSTRSFNYPGGNGGSWGGMDDRFDFQFFNDNIIDGSQGVAYLSGTYKAFGNDGYHFNDAIIDSTVYVPSGTLNNDLPDSMAHALFNMSDHLPIVSKLVVSYPTPAKLQLQANLEGAYNVSAGLMHTNLRDATLIPAQQPYNVLPWMYSGTESTITPGDIPSNAVDWVLVELRNPLNPIIVEDRKAGFLLNDGTLARTTGEAGVCFGQAVAGNYYVALKHRNHLPVISANPISVNNATMVDFRLPSNIMDGNRQLTAMGNTYALRAGDGEEDGTITTHDLNLYKQQLGNGTSQYLRGDFNMNGFVNGIDFDLLLRNIGWVAPVQVR